MVLKTRGGRSSATTEWRQTGRMASRDELARLSGNRSSHLRMSEENGNNCVNQRVWLVILSLDSNVQHNASFHSHLSDTKHIWCLQQNCWHFNMSPSRNSIPSISGALFDNNALEIVYDKCGSEEWLMQLFPLTQAVFFSLLAFHTYIPDFSFRSTKFFTRCWLIQLIRWISRGSKISISRCLFIPHFLLTDHPKV